MLSKVRGRTVSVGRPEKGYLGFGKFKVNFSENGSNRAVLRAIWAQRVLKKTQNALSPNRPDAVIAFLVGTRHIIGKEACFDGCLV